MKLVVRLLPLAGAAIAAGALVIPAFASGPGNSTGNGNESTGRNGEIVLTCDGVDYQVAAPNPDNSAGAAQIVSEQGHFIPVSGAFIVTDVTTGGVVDIEGDFGNGQGHRKQDTVECTATIFSGTAGEFGIPNVNLDDIIVGTIDVFAVAKP